MTTTLSYGLAAFAALFSLVRLDSAGAAEPEFAVHRHDNDNTLIRHVM
jgi:hypothetical protein